MDDDSSFGDEVHLVRDAKGIAIIGSHEAVERFVAAEGVPSRAVDVPRLSQILTAGSGAAGASARVAAESGRWIKLTKQSAEKLSTSTPMKGSTADVPYQTGRSHRRIPGIAAIPESAGQRDVVDVVSGG